MISRIEDFFSNAEQWQEELELLRRILLDCGLTEELKWGVPVYTFRGKNVIGMGGLKESCALSFFKGALLEDAECLLIKPGENTQSGRWLKFTSVGEIIKMEPVLKAYIFEAIEVEKAGVKLEMKKTSDYPVPDELQVKLDAMPALKAAFESLTPGRQRGYLLHFAQPKQSKTREARIEKYISQIMKGKGITD